jgi:hypothetical protein
LSLGLIAETAVAQAPESAGLWRVAAASLIVPPALTAGPASVSWNPAQVPNDRRVNAGIEIIHTSSELGISGVLGGVSAAIGSRTVLSAIVGRLDVRDLVRTTTTPTAVGGAIPVYTQYAGVSGQLGLGPAQLAAVVRFHDERFDALSETGLTLDVGVRLQPTPRISIAGATHFLPIDFSSQSTSDYYLGLEYLLLPRTRVGTLSASLVARYGGTLRSGEDLEHLVSLGILLGRSLQLDAALTREAGPETHSLRPGLGLSLRLGRYSIGLARSSGLNGLGATYRMGLDAAIL